MKEQIMGEFDKFSTNRCGFLIRGSRVWVLDFGGIMQTVLEEAHMSRFLINPGATKMYRYLRLSYWWSCIKRDSLVC